MSAECPAYYLQYCAAEVWPLVILGLVCFVSVGVYERGDKLLAPRGWIPRFIFKATLLYAGFFLLIWNVGIPKLGPLEKAIAACNAKHLIEYLPACTH